MLDDRLQWNAAGNSQKEEIPTICTTQQKLSFNRKGIPQTMALSVSTHMKSKKRDGVSYEGKYNAAYQTKTTINRKGCC
jgi:hypothetical protein